MQLNKFSLIGFIFITIVLILNPISWVLFFDKGDGFKIIDKLILLSFDLILISLSYLFFKQPKVKVPSKNDIILFFSISILSLFILEFSLRAYIKNFTSREKFLKYGSKSMVFNSLKDNEFLYSAHPYLGYFPTPEYSDGDGNYHNSLGFRGEEIIEPKPDNEIRIVCIGGSTTYTTGVKNYKNSYPYLLEEKLKKKGFDKVNVINAGVGNADTWYSFINFSFRVLDLDPDYLIIYHGDNDIETRMVYPINAYKSDNTGAVSPLIKNYKEDRLIDKLMITRVLGLSDSGALKKIFKRIKSYGSLNKLYVSETSVYDKYFQQLKAGIYPKGIFTEIDALEILEKNKPIYTYRNIYNIIQLAKSYDIKVVLTSFFASPQTINSLEVSSKLYQTALKENNIVMRNLAKEFSLPFFDFEKKMSPDKKYWASRGVHVNELGSDLKSQLFSEFLIKYVLR